MPRSKLDRRSSAGLCKTFPAEWQGELDISIFEANPFVREVFFLHRSTRSMVPVHALFAFGETHVLNPVLRAGMTLVGIYDRVSHLTCILVPPGQRYFGAPLEHTAPCQSDFLVGVSPRRRRARACWALTSCGVVNGAASSEFREPYQWVSRREMSGGIPSWERELNNPLYDLCPRYAHRVYC